MSPELKAAAAFCLAALVTYLVTPLCIRLAELTGFYDLPKGYKGHKRPTPYLGGTAIFLGIVVAVVAIANGVQDHPLIIVCAVGIWVMGTIDDRFNLPISLRTFAEVGIAVALWATGRGWDIFGYGPADLALTVVWVVGVMNAFNLMDNMDGAASSTAAVSAIGAGVLALMSGDGTLAVLAFGVAGACVAFLPRNLASRIFMGDGGSLVLGLLIARMTMAAVTQRYLGPSGVVVAALLVGLVIFDTTLVVISRSRAGVSVLTGGRDHLSHRLAGRLGAPRNVALALAGAQLVLCAITISVAQAGLGWVLLAGGLALVAGGFMIWQFERSVWFQRAVAVAASPSSEQADELRVAEASLGTAVPTGVPLR
ncbi:MAG TPA: MraY family glycosyltransferase [Solirubrobacteraceae bacterium]|nr:MraY family glycosyltransferase [Solirubrobacteraceae bacterium]